AAEDINTFLGDFDFISYSNKIDGAIRAIGQVTSQIQDLEQLVTAFNNDDELTASKQLRCKGYSCPGQFGAYATAARELLGSYRVELETLQQNVGAMARMYELTEDMKKQEGRFAFTVPIPKKFELSLATVSLYRTKTSLTSEHQKSADNKQNSQNA